MFGHWKQSMTDCERNKAGLRTEYLDDQVHANYIYIYICIKTQEGCKPNY